MLCVQSLYAQQIVPLKEPSNARVNTPELQDTLLPKPVFGSTSFKPLPMNFSRDIQFDARTKMYMVRTLIGNNVYGLPQYLTVMEYNQMMANEMMKNNWKSKSAEEAARQRSYGLIAPIEVRSEAFRKIFGGNLIDIQPRGEAQLVAGYSISRTDNPLFNEKQRSRGKLDFDQKMQMDVLGSVGERLKMKMNYNSVAEFDFENQTKLDFTGDEDSFLKKIEIGNVNLPLNSALINGSQSLFGMKTQLQFGRLSVATVISHQKTQEQQLNISNGSVKSEFRISAADYEANRHYFLAQFFKDNYNRFSSNPLLITSGINITRVEVWITNKSGNTTNSRDVLALMDLGENKPWNTALINGGFSSLPSGFSSNQFPVQSNNLLSRLPIEARQTNANQVISFFAAHSGADNFAKMIYARKLNDTEFSYHTQLGYISLARALNSDEILAVSYRYTHNGTEYQVGEFSSDVPVETTVPNVLYAKLLKNEILKVTLPTWQLMMKNIYQLGSMQINRQNFNVDVTRLENQTGVESPVAVEGVNLVNRRWLNITGLDLLNQQQDLRPDGLFDFMTTGAVQDLFQKNNGSAELSNGFSTGSSLSFGQRVQSGYITIDQENGRIIFPVIEPFGKDLAARFTAAEQALIGKYTYQALYDSTKVIAQQLFADKNRFLIRGSYQSDISSEFFLAASNVQPGTVKVFSGAVPLVEGVDFAVDYQAGKLSILNTGLLNSGQIIRISTEDEDTFGKRQRTILGAHLDYKVSHKLNLGATYMSLREKSLTPKTNVGEESLSNSMWGLDFNYSSESKRLTKLLNALPFINTKVPSMISVSGEFARFVPGHSPGINTNDEKKGVSYLDDFEDAESVVDLKTAAAWQLSGTPQLFQESRLVNDLAYGFNRAKLAFYTIDPTFYERGARSAVSLPRVSIAELSNHYVRKVVEQEVFPFKEIPTSLASDFPILNLSYYPTLRGAYNYSVTAVDAQGHLQNPRTRWGGMFRRIETSDFETLNIGYIEMWMMDPYLYKPAASGGDLYLNLGNISEDILKDGRKSLENGLSADGDPSRYDETVWGRVPKMQPVVQSFENNSASRKAQDVGLDGLSNADERVKFADIVDQMKNRLGSAAMQALLNDPSSDDYHYFKGADLDQQNAGILKRYEQYNGTEGNSKTPQQSKDELGLENSAATALPDGEDVNRDNNMTQSEEYFQYKLSLRPSDLVVGKNYVTDKVISQVKLANGLTQPVTWYQIRIPIAEYQQKVGDIQDFKSIRFMRMFMTNFEDTTVLRFAKLQLVRGDWRQYNAKNELAQVIADPRIVPAVPDQSTVEIATVNVEENAKRIPIPYVLPPGLARERDFSNYAGNTSLNEQSLVLKVKALKDGYSRAVFKTGFNDFRSYGRLEMFVHLEANGMTLLKDNDLSAFIRIGTDHQDNYYEYIRPLLVTAPGSSSATSVWPEQNKIDIALDVFQRAKLARNKARGADGGAWNITIPYVYQEGGHTVLVKGQPDMSKVRVYMLGLRNPMMNAVTNTVDDGQEKYGEVWFNELRLTEFDQSGGWAANARLTAKLADLGDVTVSGSRATAGFATLDAAITERRREDVSSLDMNSSLELGKLLPAAAGLSIPMFVSYSRQVSTPEYDPRMPDIALKTSLAQASTAEKKAILEYAQDFTVRNSISFLNVRKERTAKTGPQRLWDVENLNFSYSYAKYLHHDFMTSNHIQKSYNGSIAYQYNGQGLDVRPFDKLIKSNLVNILKDINFNPIPNRINFRMDVNRNYATHSIRNNDLLNPIAVNNMFSNNALITRLYGVSWNLTKSLLVDFDATNYSVIDQSDDVYDLKRNLFWSDLRTLGRNTDYTHNLNIGYTLPVHKLPGMDWVSIKTRYSTNFNWQTEPLATLRDPDINLGNSIQNARTIQINPSLNFVSLYYKFNAYRKSIDAFKSKGSSGALVNLLTFFKTLNASYSRTDGTYMPGYLPGTQYFGIDKASGAPGFGFVFGAQADLRRDAVEKGWITRDTLQYQLYSNTSREDLNVTGMLEPVQGLHVTLTANKASNKVYTSNFRFNAEKTAFSDQGALTSGSYAVSFISLRTMLSGTGRGNGEKLFAAFLANRGVASARLGGSNTNSAGMTNGFADGYNKNSQEVLVSAFLATYKGKDAGRRNLPGFPGIPLPNWRVVYSGLAKLDLLDGYMESLDLRHAYRSVYSVNSFNSVPQYKENAAGPLARDENGNFLPLYQFAQVAINETLSPLIGLDARFKNNVTANLEVGKTRMLALSMANSQLAELSENNVIFGLGYRTTKFRFPFGLFQSLKMDGIMDFKIDAAIRDQIAVIYREDAPVAEVSAGFKRITMKPSLNYILNQRFNIQLYYDTDVVKPYTSAAFRTSTSNFGFILRITAN